MDPFVEAAKSMREGDDAWKAHPAYYLFESWDVGIRPQAVLDQAVADGVDLNADYLVRCVGTPPHQFQTGFALDDQHFLRVLFSGNQVGKSAIVVIEPPLPA